MQDQRTREQTARDGAAALGTQTRVAPSSSRMLTGYMSYIEQLLDERQWEAALREALDLPQIAVALGNPQLSISSEATAPDAPRAHATAGIHRDTQ